MPFKRPHGLVPLACIWKILFCSERNWPISTYVAINVEICLSLKISTVVLARDWTGNTVTIDIATYVEIRQHILYVKLVAANSWMTFKPPCPLHTTQPSRLCLNRCSSIWNQSLSMTDSQHCELLVFSKQYTPVWCVQVWTYDQHRPRMRMGGHTIYVWHWLVHVSSRMPMHSYLLIY